ncbi:ankyrin-3-like isoform X9 [Anneissia japonica]|uniref:ankyrin-3-like isoform X9 n=1 Tax=Anneissia japonica TaxID=1529436 RepID=UPI00142553B3|nr:ankyrin-3-like isoform X9 [Anneissia japonica]
MKPSYLEAEVKDMPELKEEATGEVPSVNDDDDTAKKFNDKPGLTDGNASFLRAARAGNLDKVFDYLKGSTDINTSNANGLNALHLSSKEGHLNIVTELLKRGADVDAATKKGNTALHIASLAGQFGIVKVLVNYSANVNIQSQNGFTPLYMAAQENHVDVVQFLLKSGANQNLATEDGFRPLDVATQQGHHVIVALLLECQHSKPTSLPQPQQQISQSESEDGFTPLAVALQQGHDKVVAVLLENDRAGKTRLPALHIAARKDDSKAAALLLQNEHDPDVTSKSGFTPLHIASHYGHVNVAILLIQKGATIDYAAKNNITPLHVASKWGRVNMINTLLDRGAKIDAKTRDGLTPLHCAARSGHDQSVDQLIERGAPVTSKTKNGLAPLHMAAQGDHVDSARLLLFHKAPVDDVTVDYLTPLHVAAHCGHHKVAKLLLDRKANPDARALNGFTPLHIACKKNRIKVIELLLKYGASIQSTTDSGLTPLHVAAFMGNAGNTLFLLKHGAIIDEPNVRGETPLHLAARANQIEIMRILLNSKAVVDARANENQTPLHIAARLGNVEVVTLLLEQGANPDSQTKDLYTALHIAAREGKEDVAAALLEHGASLSKKTKKEFTPLHVAAKYGRLGVASLLLRHCASPDAKAQNDLTPLHIAAHYDHVDVAMLLLDQKASPISVAKNGFTPLHIAAKKNQIEIATTLLEYNADPNAVTKHGISPIHLAAQEGHTDMLSLLIDKGARPGITAKNGLTPLHLAAQEDKVNCAAILVKSGSEIDPKTKAGYTPLHIACHYGNIKTAIFLLRHGADIKSKTKHGNTPLHQAAQQGHVGVINQLLENGADPNETANNGYTPLGVAKRLGYISVINTLTTVTTRTETITITTTTEEKFKVQCPEIMVVNFMSEDEDEDEESGDDISMTGDHGTLTADEIKILGDDSIVRDNRLMEQDWLGMDPDMKYYSGAGSLSGYYRQSYTPSRASTIGRGDDSILGPDLIEGEVITMSTQQSAFSAPPPLSHSTPGHNGHMILSPDDGCPSFNGIDGRSTATTHSSMQSGFLISFMVDARGGTLSSCRMPGMRVVVPPNKATGPTRVTCRLVKHSKLITQPPVMESEALASRIIEVGPSGAQFLGGLGKKLLTYPPLSDGEMLVSRILEMGPVSEKFLGPVLLEVPHFASLRNGQREIVVLRSDTGENWKEHSLNATEEEVAKALDGYKGEDNNIDSKRVCRILTKDFPQYFAIISRINQETNSIGTNGGELRSLVEPKVTASFPMGTLTKKIKVGLQVQPVPHEVVKKVLGNRVMVSPIVTIEPRRRKFHKPITVTIPVPTAYNQGMANGYGSDSPTLRLLCSITGGTAPAQWEDITGSTPLSFSQDCCVSFTTTVSARFWLMDCKEIDQASTFSRELYQELRSVPFMSRFAVFAKTHDPLESRVRVFCSTDDRIDRGHFENQEHFTEVARSKEVEVLEGRPVYIELAGNLLPVQKSGDQLNMSFHAFHDNRMTFFVRVRDQSQEACGRLSFMREPKVTKGMPPQKAMCNLNVTMPEYVKVKKESESESESSEDEEEYRMEKGERNIYTITQVDESDEFLLNQEAAAKNLNFASIAERKKYSFLQDPVMSPTSSHMRAELRLMDVAKRIGTDWQRLGRELKVLEKDLQTIENENDVISEQAFVMLHNWSEKSGPEATCEKLEAALQAIGRGEIADECLGEFISLDVTIEQEEEKERSSPEEETNKFTEENEAAAQDDIMNGQEEVTETDLNRDAALSQEATEQKLLQEDSKPKHALDTQDELYTDRDMQEALTEPYAPEQIDELDEMTPAEIYEEIKEEIWEKHEEERQEMVFEPEFETVVEAQEEEILETDQQEEPKSSEIVIAEKLIEEIFHDAQREYMTWRETQVKIESSIDKGNISLEQSEETEIHEKDYTTTGDCKEEIQMEENAGVTEEGLEPWHDSSESDTDRNNQSTQEEHQNDVSGSPTTPEIIELTDKSTHIFPELECLKMYDVYQPPTPVEDLASESDKRESFDVQTSHMKLTQEEVTIIEGEYSVEYPEDATLEKVSDEGDDSFRTCSSTLGLKEFISSTQNVGAISDLDDQEESSLAEITSELEHDDDMPCDRKIEIQKDIQPSEEQHPLIHKTNEDLVKDQETDEHELSLERTENEIGCGLDEVLEKQPDQQEPLFNSPKYSPATEVRSTILQGNETTCVQGGEGNILVTDVHSYEHEPSVDASVDASVTEMTSTMPQEFDTKCYQDAEEQELFVDSPEVPPVIEMASSVLQGDESTCDQDTQYKTQISEEYPCDAAEDPLVAELKPIVKQNKETASALPQVDDTLCDQGEVKILVSEFEDPDKQEQTEETTKYTPVTLNVLQGEETTCDQNTGATVKVSEHQEMKEQDSGSIEASALTEITSTMIKGSDEEKEEAYQIEPSVSQQQDVWKVKEESQFECDIVTNVEVKEYASDKDYTSELLEKDIASELSEMDSDRHEVNPTEGTCIEVGTEFDMHTETKEINIPTSSNIQDQAVDVQLTPSPPADLEIADEINSSKDPETPEISELPDTPETFGDSSNTEGESPLVLSGNWPKFSQDSTRQPVQQIHVLTESLSAVSSIEISMESSEKTKEFFNGPTEQDYYDQSLAEPSRNQVEAVEESAGAEPILSEQEAHLFLHRDDPEKVEDKFCEADHLTGPPEVEFEGLSHLDEPKDDIDTCDTHHLPETPGPVSTTDSDNKVEDKQEDETDYSHYNVQVRLTSEEITSACGFTNSECMPAVYADSGETKLGEVVILQSQSESSSFVESITTTDNEQTLRTAELASSSFNRQTQFSIETEQSLSSTSVKKSHESSCIEIKKESQEQTSVENTCHSRELESGTEIVGAVGGSELTSPETPDAILTRDLTHVRRKHRDLHAYNESEGRISSFYSFNTVSQTSKSVKSSKKSKASSSKSVSSLKRAVSLQETTTPSSSTNSKGSRKVYKRSISERVRSIDDSPMQEVFKSETKQDDLYSELHGVSQYVGEISQPIELYNSSCFILLNSSYEPVDEALNFDVSIGASQEKHVMTEEEMDQLTNAMNEIAKSEEDALLSTEFNEVPGMENGGAAVEEDTLDSNSAEVNLNIDLNQLSAGDEDEMKDLLNRDFSKYTDGDNKTVLERMSEDEIAAEMAAFVDDIPSDTPSDPTPSNKSTVLNPVIQEDLTPDVHCTPPPDTAPSCDQDVFQKPYLNGHDNNDNLNEVPMTPEIKITNHDEAFIYAETNENVESVPFDIEENEPIAEQGEPGQEPVLQAEGFTQVHSAPPSQPDDNDDTTETVEQFKETLPDGSIRIVTRRKVVRKVTQHVEVEGEPALIEGGDNIQRKIVVQKKVTNTKVIVDGEEVDQSQDIKTNIVEDGEEIADATELRGDLQQIVDNFLQDEVTLDDNQNEA